MLGESFLLTAAHVADLQASGSLYLPGAGGASQFVGGIGFNNLRSGTARLDDRFDVAFLKPILDPSSSLPREYQPVPRKSVDLLGTAAPGDLCLVVGFPISPAWTKRKPDGIHSARLAFVGRACEPEKYAKLGYDTGVTVLFDFDRKRSLAVGGAKAPSPRGVSGGGIFRVKEHTTDGTVLASELIGVMYSFHEKEGCFAATRLPHYLRSFMKRFPTTFARSSTPNPSIEGMPKRLRLLCTPHVKR
jgi:hypothetical protein